MAAERLLRAFWPLWSIALAGLAVVMLGLHDLAAIELVWIGLVIVPLAGIWALVRGLRRFRWPSGAEARARLDATLPGRPLAALGDTQAIGAGDAASRAVWEAHRARMSARLAAAKPVRPDTSLTRFDPFGLRFVALMLFAAGLLFGSVWKADTIAGMAPGRGGAVASGPTWEGWIEPPRYSGQPSLYLADLPATGVSVPEGSKVMIRLYGEVGALTLAETVSGRTEDIGSVSDPVQDFEVAQSGEITIAGPGGRSWALDVAPDAPPSVTVEGALDADAAGELSLPFAAADDFGVEHGRATVTLDLAAVDRSYGRAPEPEPREPLVIDLPMPIAGDRRAFEEVLAANLSTHPWANLPVRVHLEVADAMDQTGRSAPLETVLPGRRFFVPLAKAIIEQRQALLWNRANAAEVAMVLRAVSHRPEGLFKAETDYLRLRFAVRGIEASLGHGSGLSAESRDEIARALWDLALRIEDGDLSNAMERLRRAQERLAEAMRNGASEEEIAELMQELREAMQDYMRQLAEQQQEQGQQQAENQESMEITGDQLQDMLDRLQQLMEEGRMAEAQQLLDMLSRMMENMQIAQGQGQGQGSPGQQAMNDLQEMLRDQQDLSDESFRELQDQFNQPGQQPGQQQPGQPGQQQGEGQPGQPGQQPGEGGPGPGQGLADRQQALRDELNRQQQQMPGSGGAGEALDRAGRAMDGAEEALRGNDMAGALDRQAEAMDALRDGMQALQEEMAQGQMNGEGQPGGQQGQAAEGTGRDPLGRLSGEDGNPQTSGGLVPEETPAGRARDLQDEIRRRATDRERPEAERDYLNRLLERF
ncbi:TIGR02302 family protein [Mangrovicoccus sp. HB182678]|uniref:TIGR02302 family protein n=2 Tax=Mangrovicoccus algicola TaxID=2771008 RepID=A0A8J6YWS8_9RHOB|nr:TIGR02302 family protein [Mangrovicoccus algicola]MBE3639325.1 TIGR02302 family protein [Mangrovicoccus algicola]